MQFGQNNCCPKYNKSPNLVTLAAVASVPVNPFKSSTILCTKINIFESCSANASEICFCFWTVWHRFGEILPLWEKFTSYWKIFDALFLIWQNAEPTLANLSHFWANFHCCKWPNIEQLCNHLVTLLLKISVAFKLRSISTIGWAHFSIFFWIANFGTRKTWSSLAHHRHQLSTSSIVKYEGGKSRWGNGRKFQDPGRVDVINKFLM